MSLIEIASLITILAAIFVSVIATLIWRELRRNTKLTQVANNLSLAQISSPFNLLMAQDPKLADLWLRGAGRFCELNELDKQRYRFLLFYHLSLQENIFYQQREGLLDPTIDTSWLHSFETFVKQHHLDQHWEEIKVFYTIEFVNFVAGTLSQQ